MNSSRLSIKTVIVYDSVVRVNSLISLLIFKSRSGTFLKLRYVF